MGGEKTKKDLHFHCWVKNDIISFEQKSEDTTQIVASAKDGVNEKSQREETVTHLSSQFLQ